LREVRERIDLSTQPFILVEPFLPRIRRIGEWDVLRGAYTMAMRPMMNDQQTITRTDLFVVSALLVAAVLLMVFAQVLGFTLL
jgi:hypothetical protein